MGGVSFCASIAWGPPVKEIGAVLRRIDGYVVVKYLTANQLEKGWWLGEGRNF
jgi:hypothetical protein